MFLILILTNIFNSAGPTTIFWVALIIILILLAGFVIFRVGYLYRKKFAEREIGSAEIEAEKIVQEAARNAEAKKKEILLEAKEDALKLKNDVERECKDRRNDVSRIERRIEQKEESLDKKSEAFEKKEEQLAKKNVKVDELKQNLEKLKNEQSKELERVSGLTREEAKSFLLRNLEDEVKLEMAVLVKDMVAKAKAEADKKAKDIIVTAIQRCAVDHVTETTVSVVSLPSDEMKGRIIGREGRNIRAIESLTGIDLIIDDTPEAVILSGFDPMRREIAKIALEKLIADGRVHPARIEEMVEKAKKEVEVLIREDGESAVFETGVHGLHHEIIRLIGKLRFRTSYGQNILTHSLEVSHLCGLMATELGIDTSVAKRAGLLHDIGKSIDHDLEGSHVSLGVTLLKKYKESEEIIHAVEAHHGDVEAHSIYAVLVQAADAMSAARPGSRRETLETYVKRLQNLEDIADKFEGVEKSFAIQAGRELRVVVYPDKVNDDTLVLLARNISKQIESELEFPGQIKVSLIRETRAIEYAK